MELILVKIRIIDEKLRREHHVLQTSSFFAEFSITVTQNSSGPVLVCSSNTKSEFCFHFTKLYCNITEKYTTCFQEAIQILLTSCICKIVILGFAFIDGYMLIVRDAGLYLMASVGVSRAVQSSCRRGCRWIFIGRESSLR